MFHCINFINKLLYHYIIQEFDWNNGHLFSFCSKINPTPLPIYYRALIDLVAKNLTIYKEIKTQTILKLGNLWLGI